MKLIAMSGLVLCVFLTEGCKKSSTSSGDPNRDKDSKQTLAEARKGFQTKLVNQLRSKEPAPNPPPALFRLVRYESSVGKLPAYLSNDPKDGEKHPAIIWIFGGFGNDIGDTAWRPASPKNDRSASAFRKAGIVMMYPALRGGHDNVGVREDFYGEVDDIVAAAEFLAKQDFVDPARIYLGGHSTGGTLVLLTAECSDRFRAVFSFGPADDVRGYGRDELNFDLSNEREFELRAPGRWLHSIKNPTFVFEGTAGGNIQSLKDMSKASANPQLHFHPVNGVDHFSILAPLTRLVASKVVADTGPSCGIQFTADDISGSLRK